jgi:hypothetical protein
MSRSFPIIVGQAAENNLPVRPNKWAKGAEISGGGGCEPRQPGVPPLISAPFAHLRCAESRSSWRKHWPHAWEGGGAMFLVTDGSDDQRW